jgi:hypothetical protein
MGPLRLKTLTLVLVATVVGAQRPGANLSDGLTGTSDIPGLYGRPPTILILAGAPQGHPDLSGPLRHAPGGLALLRQLRIGVLPHARMTEE